jgi:hypothetical protein
MAYWDIPLNENEAEEWSLFHNRLMSLKVEVNRCVVPHNECRTVYLIGFPTSGGMDQRFLSKKRNFDHPYSHLERMNRFLKRKQS